MPNEHSISPSTNGQAMRPAPLMLILVAAVILATLAVSRWNWLPPTATSASALPQSSANTGPKAEQNIRFTLYDVGILPRQVRTPPGRVSISIVDRSGGSSGITIERLNGSQHVTAGQVQRAAYQQHGRQELELQSGTYLVTMIDRPDNSATLIVDP